MAGGAPSYPLYPTIPNVISTPSIPSTVPSTNVNLQVDPQVLNQLVRIATALEQIVEKMGHGFD